MRILYGIFLTVAYLLVHVLCILNLNCLQNSGEEEGLYIAGQVQYCGIATPVIYSVGAVGVFLFGWYWLKLAGLFTSIAGLFNKEKAGSAKQDSDILSPMKISGIQKTIEAVSEHLRDDAVRIAKYEQQIKELQIQIQVSKGRETNTEAIIHSIRDAVIVIDEFDKILMANEAAGKLFNFDFKSSHHRPLKEVIPDRQNEFLNFLSHSIKSEGQAARREITITDIEESGGRIFDSIVSCIYNKNRQVCGAVAVLHDITREKEISKMKNDFVSHVSHELKTPLASITAYSEMLADGEADDEETRKEFYAVIQTQAKRLNRLIEDVLNTSRIESGLIKVNKEPVSLTILIEEQLQMIKSYAEEKNIKVIGQKPIVFDQVYVDRDMISQVVVNLLSNAVKYTPKGGTVKIVTEADEIAGLVRVSVTDTGVGIPEDEVQHVFDKYYRVGVNNKQAKGTGLGLNLVKQIIEKVHDGRVFVESQAGKGSTFGFELPLTTGKTMVSDKV